MSRPTFACYFAVSATTAIAACTSPARREETATTQQSLISDQLHNGGTQGFVFLPPMVPPPASNGGFLPTVPVTVRIDEITAAGSTVRTLATFTKNSGPEREHLRTHSEGGPCDADDHDGDSDAEGYYLARWETDDAHLSESAHYRVRVSVPSRGAGARELGFADVDVARTMKEFRSVDTQNFAPLLNGATLRIKFRVDWPAVDQDHDGVFDWVDDCPTVSNPDQTDSLHNGIGDACRCLPVTCTAQDSCHKMGTCQPTTGTCTNPVAADGTACPIVNAAGACSAGSCKLTSCNTGFSHCTSNAGDGCETPTTTVTNCGTCGIACASGANSSPVCNGGTCTLSCSPGYANCDGVLANGCEQNVATDFNNCGACGHACASQEACLAGACTTAVCQAGFANCSGDASDGCNITPATDVSNCGACGHACATPNATPACSGGACAMGTCNAGFADCDRSVADGCEINVASDVANCGGCGIACPQQNDTPACNAGQCSVAACNPGFANCDGNPSSGCSINVASDTMNCGACGSACHVPNATPACNAGVCAIAACSAGFGDCNAEASDGCEIATSTDVDNCGGCGNVCPSGPNSTSQCRGTCSIVCTPGFADCDHDPTNGCEVNLNADASHCGTCGTTCAVNETCQTGTCSTAACQGTFGSCNGTACGVDTSTDPNNCGGCGTACAIPGAVATCNEGGCTFAGCKPGFADLDHNAANGCEYACPVFPPVDEACNGKDDDCDGQIDERNPAAGAICFDAKGQNSHSCLGVIDPMVNVKVSGVWVYEFEAARPDATSTSAGTNEGRACSKGNVLPWANVTESQAAAACASVLDSAGAPMRLCSGTEWQTGCVGEMPVSQLMYSETPNETVYQVNVCNDANSRYGKAVPTGTSSLSQTTACYTDWSPVDPTSTSRLYDMSGNVAEWTSTQTPLSTGVVFSVRGGAYDSPVSRCPRPPNAPACCDTTCVSDRACVCAVPTYPTSCEDTSVSQPATFAGPDVGFRCCADHAP